MASKKGPTSEAGAKKRRRAGNGSSGKKRPKTGTVTKKSYTGSSNRRAKQKSIVPEEAWRASAKQVNDTALRPLLDHNGKLNLRNNEFYKPFASMPANRHLWDPECPLKVPKEAGEWHGLDLKKLLHGKHAPGNDRVQRAMMIQMQKRMHAQASLNHQVDRADSMAITAGLQQVATLLKDLVAAVKSGGLRKSGKQAAAAARSPAFSRSPTIVRQSPFKGG